MLGKRLDIISKSLKWSFHNFFHLHGPMFIITRLIITCLVFCNELSGFSNNNIPIEVDGATNKLKLFSSHLNNEIFFSHLDINTGLSQNHISCIFKDSKGFVWIGTMAGLNRYDGNSFKIFKHVPADTTSINDNYIISIVEDNKGRLWVGTRNGLNIYCPATETFTRVFPEFLRNSPANNYNYSLLYADNKKNLFFVLSDQGIVFCDIINEKWKHIVNIANDTSTIITNSVTSIVQDSHGDYWVVHSNGIIECLNGQTFKVKERVRSPLNNNVGSNFYSAMIDSDNELWIYGTTNPFGLLRYNTSTRKFSTIKQGATIYNLNNKIVRGIVEEQKNILWFGTDHGGINVFDKTTGTFTYVLNNPDNEYSLSQNAITSLYIDNTGIIWVGTFKKGLNYYHRNLIKFRHIKHEPSNPASLGFDDVNCFAEDKKGNIWIGTNNGGIFYYDRKQNRFINYKHNPNNPNSLSSDVILKLYIDKANYLWIATYYGGLNRFDGKNFVHYRHDPKNPNSIADDRVWDIFVDSDDNFWIGTLGGGLDLFDSKKNIFYHYKAGASNSVSSDYIINIAEDHHKNLWIATANGLNVLDYKTKKFRYYFNNSNNKNSLSNNNTICVLPDSRGYIWVGTREGLGVLNTKTDKFNNYYTSDGLSDNFIQSIIEDNEGNIWVGTPNGLTKICVLKTEGDNLQLKFFNYDKSDGLQGKEFNEKSVYKLSTGELLFGGPNGFNIFNPSAIEINNVSPKIVFTDFQLFNKSVKVGEKINRRVLLKKSIVETKKIVLKYTENVFSIEFAALNYFHPEKNKYAYKLEGFNKDWLIPDYRQNKVTYTNLDPGVYTFRVKASNDDGIWNEQGATLEIEILPPFYRTWIAYVLYILFIILVLLLARKILLDRARMRFNIENERREAQRMHELDMMKIRFFTNISHEFRTPLTLILAPLEKIIKNITDKDLKNQLIVMQRNASRLLRLVNQLLDFRRMEVEPFKLNLQYADIVAFTKDIAHSFTDVAEMQRINFTFHSNVSILEMQFDTDKMDKILFNLLSNAFKFTPEGGAISVELHYFEEQQMIEIRVSDTGIGIEPDKQERIFDQFFQTETTGSIINQGSGIGLALVKEFVRLHNGNIKVESDLGKGSTFTVSIPVNQQLNYVSKEFEENIHESIDFSSIDENKLIDGKSRHGFTVLLIEDNHDLRFYLKDNLRHKFKIIEASKGKEGLQKAFQLLPDLIVCDILLPEMDGIEICRKLKNDKRTSHIPIILLTAQSDTENKISGFEAGADDYITKPFSYEILESRIKNLIEQREKLKRIIDKHFEINPSEIEVESQDEKLVKKAIELVEKNIENTDFSVEDLSRELGMSRVHLYKKLLALTGKTPIEFIRIIRLKRAAQLLQSSQLTVSEVAYKVGFNNPKYFARYFKEEFGVLPSVYAKKETD